MVRRLNLLFLCIGLVVLTACNAASRPSVPAQNTLCVKSGENNLQMTLIEAQEIAGTLQSECMQLGSLKATGSCNEGTGTWWLDFTPKSQKDGCNPACVVSLATKTAEVNWRCTGLA